MQITIEYSPNNSDPLAYAGELQRVQRLLTVLGEQFNNLNDLTVVVKPQQENKAPSISPSIAPYTPNTWPNTIISSQNLEKLPKDGWYENPSFIKESSGYQSY